MGNSGDGHPQVSKKIKLEKPLTLKFSTRGPCNAGCVFKVVMSWQGALTNLGFYAFCGSGRAFLKVYFQNHRCQYALRPTPGPSPPPSSAQLTVHPLYY